jgi:hypothetical protein
MIFFMKISIHLMKNLIKVTKSNIYIYIITELQMVHQPGVGIE